MSHQSFQKGLLYLSLSLSLFCTWVFICMCWIDLQVFLFFWVVVDFFSFKVGYTQCLANAPGNFFFSFLVLYWGIVIWLFFKTKLLCLLAVIIYDNKNKMRNCRQVRTCTSWTCDLSKFFFIYLFFYFLWMKWVFG